MRVRRTSSPSRCTTRAPRSMRSPPASTTGSPESLHARRVAQRHAHAREQLAGAERLRQVVVGPGVERLDLVRLLPARGDDHDRHGAPVADAAHDLDAVEVGQAEVEQHEVGRARLRLDERRARRCRLRPCGSRAPAASRAGSARAAARPRPRAPAARSPAVSRLSALTRPPPGAGPTAPRPAAASKRKQAPRGCAQRAPRIVPPWAVTIARAIASPRPAPGPPAARWNLSKRRSASCAGKPGPSSHTSTTARSPSRRAPTSTRPSPAVAQRVLEQVDERLLDQHGVDRPRAAGRGRRAPRCRARPPGARRGRAPSRPAPRASVHSRLGSSVPDSSRVMSSRFPTSRFRRSASSSTVDVSSRATAVAGGGCSSSALAAPVIAASGVRRSCDTELSSVLRSRSPSAATRALLRLGRELRPLERRRDQARERAHHVALLGGERPGRRGQLERQHAEPRAAALDRLVERARRGQRVGLGSRGPAVLERPLGHRRLVRVRGERRHAAPRPARGRRPWARNTAASPCSTSRCVARARGGHLARVTQPAELAAQRVERAACAARAGAPSRPPRARARRGG